MEVDDDVEDDDVDFNPFLREGSPSVTSSSLTSEAECEEHSSDNQPINPENNLGNESTGDGTLPQNTLSSKGVHEIFLESTSTHVNSENDEGWLNVLEKVALPSREACFPAVQNSDNVLQKTSEEDAICRRTRARYSLENYSLEELETFLQESDDDGDLQNVDEQEEYRKFLAAVLSGGGDDPQACQGDENQDEDENDADFELEIEEALESDDENTENYEETNGRKGKDGHRPKTRCQPFTESSGPDSYRHESTKTHLRPILPSIPPVLLTRPHVFGWQFPSHNATFPSMLPVSGFTDLQLGQLHMLIYEHVQLLIQIFSLCVLDPSKQDVFNDVKKLITELVGSRDQALARRANCQFFFEPQHLCPSYSSVASGNLEHQWVPLMKSPVMSILDVSPLQLAPGYLSDVATAVTKYRRSHVDGTADRNRRKEPLFPSPPNYHKDTDSISHDGPNGAPTASSLSSMRSLQKKSLAATLIEGTKKDTVALVPSDIARLAQRFFPLFNVALFPHKPPPQATVNRLLFTDAEDRLLALGIQEYNNDWAAIQNRFLPCKSTHQIFVRQKNRSSSKAPNNPVKEVRRMKTSPLTVEEKERIREGLKFFKNDWASVWKFVVPHRDPSLLQRQWRVASGVQKSYSKSESAKEKRRAYEAKRRKLKASMPDSRVVSGQGADNNSSDCVENDDESYVNEAFFDDRDRRMNMTPCQLSLSRNATKSMIMQKGTNIYEECGATGGGHSSAIAPPTMIPKASCGSLDQLQASQLCKEKSSRVVKLAPNLPPVNLPPSVRVISQAAFHQNASHFNGNSDGAGNDMCPMPAPTFTESAYRQLNLFPDYSTSSGLRQNGISNGNNTEDGTEQEFQMHPLLFQHPRDVLASCSHPVQNLINHARKYDLYPFEKTQVERSNSQATGSNENDTTIVANTIDFHPLLQRSEAETRDEVPEDDYHYPLSQSECTMRKALVGDQSTVEQASTNPYDRESNIDLNINLCSSNDFRGSLRQFSVPDKVSVSEIEFVNACSHHCIEEHNEESMQGIVMEQEELSDSDEDSQHVEFECEEMDDSEDEQVQGEEASLIQNKITSASVFGEEFCGSSDQRQIQKGLGQVDKQGANSMQTPQGSSQSARAKWKHETAKRSGSVAAQGLSTCTVEPSRTKTRSSKTQQEQSIAVCNSSDSRTRKAPAPT